MTAEDKKRVERFRLWLSNQHSNRLSGDQTTIVFLLSLLDEAHAALRAFADHSDDTWVRAEAREALGDEG